MRVMLCGAGRSRSSVKNTHFERFAPGIGRAHDQLAHLRLAGPGSVHIFKVVAALVPGMIAHALQDKRSGLFGGVPLVALVVLFPSDEVIIGGLDDPSKDWMTENASVDDRSQKSFLGQAGLSAKVFGHFKEALAQVLVIIAPAQIDRKPLGSMDKVGVRDFVGKTDARAPAFEDLLQSGVVLGALQNASEVAHSHACEDAADAAKNN